MKLYLMGLQSVAGVFFYFFVLSLVGFLCRQRPVSPQDHLLNEEFVLFGAMGTLFLFFSVANESRWPYAFAGSLATVVILWYRLMLMIIDEYVPSRTSATPLVGMLLFVGPFSFAVVTGLMQLSSLIKAGFGSAASDPQDDVTKAD